MITGLKALRLALIVSTTMVCTLSTHSWALLAPSASVATPEGKSLGRDADLKTIQGALESKIVSERLKALGLSDAEIASRLAKLDDQQVHKLAKDVDTLSAGGNVGAILVVVILVLLIVYLIKRV